MVTSRCPYCQSCCSGPFTTAGRQEPLSRALLSLLASEVQKNEAKDRIPYKIHVTVSDKLSTVLLHRDSCRAVHSSYHHTVISCEIFPTQAARQGGAEDKSFQEIPEDTKYKLTQVPCTGKHPLHWPQDVICPPGQEQKLYMCVITHSRGHLCIHWYIHRNVKDEGQAVIWQYFSLEVYQYWFSFKVCSWFQLWVITASSNGTLIYLIYCTTSPRKNCELLSKSAVFAKSILGNATSPRNYFC